MEMIDSKINGFVADYTCVHCKHQQKANIFPYINFNQNPEYYSKVKDLSIFNAVCENCGKKNIIQFDTLLIDETHQYFLYLLSDKSIYRSFKYKITYFVETTFNSNDKYDLDKFKTRVVFSLNDLIEKMSIFEEGLNDEAIEVVKVGLKDKNLIDNAAYDSIFFDGLENANLEFVAFSSKTSTKEPKRISIDHEFYNKVVDDISNLKDRPKDYFEVVDEDWVRSKFTT